FFSSRRRHTRSKRDWSSDVCSSDLIAMHDTKVDRNTNGEGLVKDKKLDAGSWFSQGHRGEKVPELAEILEKYYNKTNFYIETKKPDTYPGMDKQLVEELNKKVLLSKSKLKKGKVIVQSY